MTATRQKATAAPVRARLHRYAATASSNGAKTAMTAIRQTATAAPAPARSAGRSTAHDRSCPAIRSCHHFRPETSANCWATSVPAGSTMTATDSGKGWTATTIPRQYSRELRKYHATPLTKTAMARIPADQCRSRNSLLRLFPDGMYSDGLHVLQKLPDIPVRPYTGCINRSQYGAHPPDRYPGGVPPAVTDRLMPRHAPSGRDETTQRTDVSRIRKTALPFV
jgi:hypothetical protein